MFAVQLKHEIEQMFSAFCRAGQGSGVRGEQGDGGVHKCMCMWYICVRICLMYLWHFQGQHKIQKKINIKHNNFSAGGFKVS